MKNAAGRSREQQAQIADRFVSDKVDLICAIATPSAQAAYNAAMDSDIPVIYTAVTDPVAAELANEDGTPVGNVTGTSDELPVEAQLKMIREMLPDAKKIGILVYNKRSKLRMQRLKNTKSWQRIMDLKS